MLLPRDSPDRSLIVYFGLAYLINLYICSGFTAFTQPEDWLSQLFVFAITVTYPAIYMAVPAVLAVILALIIKQPIRHPAVRLAPLAIIVGTNALLTMVLYSDVRLYDLYGFHINAFVVNLLVTPGGVESMGGSTQTYIAVATITVGILVSHGLTYYVASHLGRYLSVGKRFYMVLASAFFALTVSERLAYGFSDSQQYAPVLKAAETIPLYNHVTFRSFARRLGLEVADRHHFGLEEGRRELNYPLDELTGEAPKPPPNIIWIVSESMRWDMLSQEIMPNTYAQSKKGWRLKRHYSGGNGTRQGLFSLFYGIYGSYWDSFLMERRSPALLDLLQNRNYQMEMFTSADFTYPEFNRTLFANIPASHLHQFNNDLSPWERDVANTQNVINTIKQRDKARPFMTFMFYESTHARYYFPESSAIREPYLEDLNYATMTRKSLAPRISELKNRYVNASYFIDSQLAKIYAALTEEGLWDSTIVMVTGDHGEEFMENGFWGHNSGFSEEQIRTPMVLWIPEAEPKVIDSVTSHMDIIPTMMPLLGITNPKEDYSLGVDLSGTFNRSYLVVSDWSGVAFLGGGYKFTLPFNSSLSSTNQLFNDSDDPIADIVPFLTDHKGDLDEILGNVTMFTRK
tara:strand:+ start:92 stop:1978 length:1887 start_codon:yes stop_codon:yes gene_type:complete